jgi:hypothetical protein
MEAKYKSLSIFEFQRLFPDEDSCYKYLVDLKWSKGFNCTKCGHDKFCKGNGKYARQCTSCRFVESSTSGTLFQGMKFSILKAFYIIYYVSTNKKGIATTELSRKLGLRQKTCWLFKQKVMNAMKTSGNFLLEGKVEVDETVVGGQEEGVVGRKNKNKKLVVFAIEKKKSGVGRVYGKVIETSSAENLGKFMEDTISKEAKIKTDKWPGYKPLKNKFVNLEQEKSGKKGENFKLMHRTIMGFKGWMRGIHHKTDYLQAYIDEYCYRFNRNFMKEDIYRNLLKRMVKGEPFPYKLMYETYA